MCATCKLLKKKLASGKGFECKVLVGVQPKGKNCPDSVVKILEAA